MWMACVLADSPFQRWALESPVLVAWEVEAMFPTYYTREDAVTILETVQETGLIEPSEDFWKRPNSTFHTISSFGFPGAISKNKDGSDPQPIISLISQSPDDSVTMDGQRFTVRYVEYIPDGSLMRDTSVYDQPVTADVTSQNTLFNACDAFEFQWYPDVDAVVVSDLPSCG